MYRISVALLKQTSLTVFLSFSLTLPFLLLYVNSCHGNYFALPLFTPGVYGW